MEQKDEIIAICSTENTGNTVGQWVPCRGCETQVWLSDSTLNAMKSQHPHLDLDKNPPSPMCMPCGFKKMMESKSTHITPPTEEQIGEITKSIRESVDNIKDTLRDR